MKILIQNLKAFVTGFLQAFSTHQRDGINDKLKRTQIIEFFLQLQEPSCPQKVKCKKVMLKN